MSYDIHQVVTDKLVAAIEAGNLAPWHKPWSAMPSAGASVASPVNVVSGREYHGINVLILWAASQVNGYASGAWLTAHQAKELGGTLRAGEGKKYEPIVWASKKSYDKEKDGTPIRDRDGNETTRSVWLTKYSFVYNVASFDGLPAKFANEGPVNLPGDERFAAIRAVVAGSNIPVHHGGNTACYSPTNDAIKMPVPQSFASPDLYYSTLAHELTHATGHDSRLARDLRNSFGSHKYAAEELVAELGAAFMCARFGIDSEPRADHAAYLAHWLGIMKADKKAIFVAAAKANQAAGWLYKAGGVDEKQEEAAALAAK